MRDLTGERFGRLRVINRLENDASGRCVWMCKCDCGNEVAVKSHYLTSGQKRSCGCLQRESNSFAHTKHGRRKDRLYRVWQSMKTRCANKNHKHFRNYGGRGISVCKEWEEDFERFYKWAMSSGYHEWLTIDRIDNDGPYCPGNCKWSTRTEQTRNRRNTIRVSYHGERKTLMEVAEIDGITYQEAYRKYANV